MSDLDKISQGGTVTKEAVSGDSIVLFTSNIANTALEERGLGIGETYEIWSNTGIPKKIGECKIEGLSGGPLLLEGQDTSWVEPRILAGGNNISIWTSDETQKIGHMGYLNDFKKDTRGGAITNINGEQYYFERVEIVEGDFTVLDTVGNRVSSIIHG